MVAVNGLQKSIVGGFKGDLMTFKKYIHLERFGTEEVEGIEAGRCYVFPKLDGANGSVWMSDEFKVECGSRNQRLAEGNTNQGFWNYVQKESSLKDFLVKNPNLRLYGEWLVPHTLKTYQKSAWRKFYVFDVFNDETDCFLSYDAYKPLLDEAGVLYVPPLASVNNADVSMFMKFLEQNVFYIKDGEGVGEGIVIKNYDYKNRYDRVCWAKMVTNQFKAEHSSNMGHAEIGMEPVELKIVEKYVTQALVDKVHAKIVNQHGGWSSKFIPQLLQTVFYDLVTEETWHFVKEFKNPTISFRALNAFTINQVKTLRKDLF